MNSVPTVSICVCVLCVHGRVCFPMHIMEVGYCLSCFFTVSFVFIDQIAHRPLQFGLDQLARESQNPLVCPQALWFQMCAHV